MEIKCVSNLWMASWGMKCHRRGNGFTFVWRNNWLWLRKRVFSLWKKFRLSGGISGLIPVILRYSTTATGAILT